MSTTTTRNRVRKGISTGGQFAAVPRPEASVALGSGIGGAGGPDPHAAAATRAILNQSARKELSDRFQGASIDHAELGRRVGHNERTARRVVTGKEPLNETTVTAYFRAMAD